MPMYDLQCQGCGHVHESLAAYNASGFYLRVCPGCRKEKQHKRLPSLFAPYMGERVLNPQVSGGKFDTMGQGKVTRLPPFRAALEHDAKVNAKMRELGDGATREAAREVLREAGPGPSMADWRDHLKKPEVKEAKRQRAEDIKRNKQKRARAGALARGETVNMRRDRLPGDPKITG
jgi:hypothetical protein